MSDPIFDQAGWVFDQPYRNFDGYLTRRPYDVLTLQIGGAAFDDAAIATLATSGFTTSADDVPAATAFLGRIAEDVDFERSVSCVFWGGGQSRNVIGAVTAINADGRLDPYLAATMRDRPFILARGSLLSGDPYAIFERCAVGVIDRVEFPNEQACTIVLADKAAKQDRPAQENLYSGEANTAINGTAKPLCIGTCLSVPAILHTPADAKYDVHEEPPHAILLVRSNGNPLIESDPSDGWDVDGNGFVLNDAAYGRYVADVEGAEDGVGALADRLPAILRYLLTERPAITGGDPPMTEDDIDWDRVNALDTAAPYTLNYWTDRPVTYRQILTELMDSFGGWWWITREGKLAVGRLQLPAETAVLALTAGDLADDAQVQVQPDTAPGYSNVCTAQRNWYVHDAGEIAGVLTSPTIAQIALDLQQDFRIRKSITPGSDDTPGGTVVDSPALTNTGIATCLSSGTDATTEVTRWAALYAAQRHFYTVPVLVSPTTALLLEPGDTVSLTLNRFGLNSGKNLLVVGIRGRLLSGRVDLRLWG